MEPVELAILIICAVALLALALVRKSLKDEYAKEDEVFKVYNPSEGWEVDEEIDTLLGHKSKSEA